MAVGRIHSFESMGLVDGPGIRSVVFLQGCKLRCKYCHNPDTWALKSDTARTVTPQQLLKRLLRFKPYYGSDGGVTFSGGEPLLQDDFLCEILPKCKENNIHTCLDTAGCGNGDYEQILHYTDLVLFDVKHYTCDGYKNITCRTQQKANEFLAAVQKSGNPLWIRHVVVPGLTDSEEHLKGLESYLKTLKNIERVELLPYHTLGVSKYSAMGLKYPLEGVEPMPQEELTEWTKRLNRTCCTISKCKTD